MKLYRLFIIFALTSAAWAQGGLYNDIALNSDGRPAGGATIRVGTTAATGTPLSPAIVVYSNAALTTVKAQPFTADAQGNFNFYGAPGPAQVQICLGTRCYTYLVNVPIDASNASLSAFNNVQMCDRATGADMAAKINACIAALPATGGIADARGFLGAQSGTATITLGSSSKPVHLLLGAVTLTSSANPVVSCPLGGTSSVAGISSGATQILYTGAAADGVTWGCSSSGMNHVGIQGQSGTRHALVLAASGTTSVMHNTFSDLMLTGQTTAGNVCLKMLADNAGALTSFNIFTNVDTVGCADSWKLDTTGTVGPTNNWIKGGHLRKTAAAGNGINVVNGGNNGSIGLDISGHAIGIRSDSASATNFQDHGSTLESNTLDVSLSNSTADNQFWGTSYLTFSKVGAIRTTRCNTQICELAVTTLSGGQVDLDTEDPNAAQVPVLCFKKTVSSLNFGCMGQITNTLSGIGANSFGILTKPGIDANVIVDATSGTPKFKIFKKGAGLVFSVDTNGRTTASGLSSVLASPPPADGTVYATDVYSNNLHGFAGPSIKVVDALAYTRVDITLANGANSDIALSGQNFARIVGPTGVFSVSGFAAGVDGRVLHLFNSVAFAMTITNEAVSTAANRITTLTGADVVLRAGKSFATFIYDGGTSRWILVSTN